MPTIDDHTTAPLGLFRDILIDGEGRVALESPWRKNVIVDSCRRLLASFMHGAPPPAGGISGLRVGAGLAAWDAAPPPLPPPTVTALADPNPFTVPPASLAIDYLDPANGNISPTPTGRLQIVATLGPGVPPWPDPNHSTITLREFGLVGSLGGSDVLINYRIHPAIAKDATSTLVRTIWLVF
jgi:hypothetical protein